MQALMGNPYNYQEGSTVEARISACNEAGCGAYSSGTNSNAVISVAAPQVMMPTETSVGGAGFTSISWNLTGGNNQFGATRYNVQYADNNANG